MNPMNPEADLGLSRPPTRQPTAQPPQQQPQQQQSFVPAPSRVPPPASQSHLPPSPMGSNRGTLGAGTKPLVPGSQGCAGSGSVGCAVSGGARPRSPRNSPLGSRGPQAVYRQCGAGAPGGPPPATNAALGSAMLGPPATNPGAQGGVPQRDGRNKQN